MGELAAAWPSSASSSAARSTRSIPARRGNLVRCRHQLNAEESWDCAPGPASLQGRESTIRRSTKPVTTIDVSPEMHGVHGTRCKDSVHNPQPLPPSHHFFGVHHRLNARTEAAKLRVDEQGRPLLGVRNTGAAASPCHTMSRRDSTLLSTQLGLRCHAIERACVHASKVPILLKSGSAGAQPERPVCASCRMLSLLFRPVPPPAAQQPPFEQRKRMKWESRLEGGHFAS